MIMTEEREQALERKFERRERNDHKRQVELDKEEIYDELPDSIYNKLYK